MPDVDRVHARVDERGDHVGEVASQRDDRSAVRRPLDRALEGERGLPGEAEQVGVGDHADHRAGAVGHGEMVDPAFEHPEEHVPDPGLSRHRHDRARHDLRDRGVGVASGGQDARAQVAVGDDPPVIADLDEERGHPLFGHQGRDLGDRRVGRRGDRWTPHLRSHRGEHVRQLGRGSVRVQASTRDRREEPGAADAPEQLLGEAPWDQITEGVFGRAHARDRPQPRDERELTEGFSLTDEIEQPPIVEDLDRPFPHDVEGGRRLAGALEDRGARREELHLGGGGDPFEPAVVEPVEGRERAQEPGDVHRSGLCARSSGRWPAVD